MAGVGLGGQKWGGWECWWPGGGSVGFLIAGYEVHGAPGGQKMLGGFHVLNTNLHYGRRSMHHDFVFGLMQLPQVLRIQNPSQKNEGCP